MGERRTEVVYYRVDLTCDDCGAVTEFTGITKTSNPPWYVHKCVGCGKVTDERRVSGGMAFVDRPAATPKGGA